MPSNYRVREEIAKRLNSYSAVPRWRHMLLGHIDGVTVQGDEGTNLAWVTGYDGVSIQVVNRIVPNNWGEIVRVGQDPSDDYPEIEQVLGYADVYDARSKTEDSSVQNHAAELHRYGKRDTDWIEPERMLWQMPIPVSGENKADLWPYVKSTPTGMAWSFTTIRIDYSAHIPSSGVRICVPVLDINGDLAFRDGAVINQRADLTKADWPEYLAGDSAGYGFWLTAGMVELHHEPGNDDLIDLRGAGIIGGGSSISSVLSVQAAGGPLLSSITKLQFPPGSVNDLGDGEAGITFPASLAGLTDVDLDPAPTDDQVLTYSAAHKNWYPSTKSSTAIGVDPIDCTDQVDGVTDTFTFSPATSVAIVLVNGRYQPSTLGVGGLSVTLGFVPAIGETVVVLRTQSVAAPTEPEYRRGATMWHDESIAIVGNDLLSTHSTYFGYQTTVSHNPPALGDKSRNSFVIAAGTYTLCIEGCRAGDQGIVTIEIDTTEIATIDFYGSTDYSHWYKVPDLVLTAGYHTITFTTSGTTGGQYYIQMTKMWFIPQAGY